MAPAQPTTLLALPDELLEVVFRRLHANMLHDALRLASTCRRLRAVSLVSDVWRSISATPVRPAALAGLADWLRRHRHRVRSLSLCEPATCAFPVTGSCCSSWPFLLSSLAGGPLRELYLGAEQGAAELGTFLGCLPHLERLQVECPALVCLPQLQQATTLTAMSLLGTWDHDEVDYRYISPSHLPRSLRELSLFRVRSSVIRDAVAGLPELDSLYLADCECQLDLCGIGNLPSLTYLGLEECWVDSLPEELSLLTTLQHLHLGALINGWDPPEGALCPLLALTRLTELVLSFPIPEWNIPDGLFSLPQLKVLVLDHLPPNEDGPPPPLRMQPLSPTLETLELHASRAAAGLQHLARLSHLTELCLYSSQRTPSRQMCSVRCSVPPLRCHGLQHCVMSKGMFCPTPTLL